MTFFNSLTKTYEETLASFMKTLRLASIIKINVSYSISFHSIIKAHINGSEHNIHFVTPISKRFLLAVVSSLCEIGCSILLV